MFIECPGEDDPRLPRIKPFTTTTLDAAMFYNGNDVVSYAWSIGGSPCDSSSRASRASSPPAGEPQLLVENAQTHEGQGPVHPQRDLPRHAHHRAEVGPDARLHLPARGGRGGLRVELCWDKTGPPAGEPADRPRLAPRAEEPHQRLLRRAGIRIKTSSRPLSRNQDFAQCRRASGDTRLHPTSTRASRAACPEMPTRSTTFATTA